VTGSTSRDLAANLDVLQVAGRAARQIQSRAPTGCRLELPSGDQPRLLFHDQSIYAGPEPLVTAAAQAQELVAGKNPDLVVFFGFGLGLHLDGIRRLTAVPIIVFEPSLDLAAFVLDRVTVTLPDIHLVTDADSFSDLLGSLLDGGRDNVLAGAIPAYTELFPTQFDQFREAATGCLHDRRVAAATQERFAVEWVSNLAANLPFLARHKSLSCLGRQFADKPAIIVGAGPSLDRNFSALAQAQGRALIIAVHTAVIPLSREGITPDLVVILEGQKLDHFFAGVTDLSQMVLLPGAQTHPAHLGLGFKDFLGIPVEGNAAADWLQKAFGEEPLKVGGSVACAAFSIAHVLGCDPLVCVGMDLSYSDGRSHALGTDLGCCDAVTDEEHGITRTHCRVGYHRDLEYATTMVPAWGGQGRVATRSNLTTFRHWFEAAARSWLAGHRLLNANGAGARIRGFDEIPLSAAVSGFDAEPVPAAVVIEQAMARAEYSDPAPFHAVVREEMGVIGQAMNTAEVAADLAERASELLRRGETGSVQPLLDALARQEQRLQDLSRRTRLLNTLVGVRARGLAAGKAAGDDVARTLYSLDQSRTISALVLEGGGELRRLFEPVLDNLEQGP